SRCRILLVSGFQADGSTGRALDVLQWFHSSEEAVDFRRHFAVAAIPAVNAETLLATQGVGAGGGGSAGTGYPPTGPAYGAVKQSQAAYLWRWIGMLAPDLVVEIQPGTGALAWQVDPHPKSEVDLSFASRLAPLTKVSSIRIASALVKNSPADVAPVPAIQVSVPSGANPLPELFRAILQTSPELRSPARKELLRRQARTSLTVARELSAFYGGHLKSVSYISALALIGRCRLTELTDDSSHLGEVQKIVGPYVSGRQPTLGQKVGGSNLSGHLIFGELAARTGQKRYVDLARVAADLGFDTQGAMKAAMPHHSQMSDAVFMGTPILVQVGRLTGETKYFDMAARHLEFMLRLNLRDDGLHQHSPLDPDRTAWGRGNGFPALGLAICLSDLPVDSPHRRRFLEVYRDHMAAMKKHQDEMGMWHQVIDHPESYREFTVTCMTTFALVRGLRRGWLERRVYEPVVQRAWQSIKMRIGTDGTLVDVCTGTGKQKSLQEYFDRTAILGRNDRGGAMALMVSTEMALAEREQAVTVTDSSAD
ncbi:MAG: glycoside hydrolase family 88 protein, partial [Planctomycetaceae bacterium]